MSLKYYSHAVVHGPHCHCHCCSQMSRLVGKPTMWFPNRSDTNRPVQAHKRARSLISDLSRRGIVVISIRVAKIKALISFAVTAKLICAFVFAYADCWFSHGAAQIIHNAQTFSHLKPLGQSKPNFMWSTV